MNNLVFDVVHDSTSLEQWKDFAGSFDHATDTPMTPIVNVSRRESDGSLRQFGFYTVFNHPVIFPSFHPEHTSPRDFHDMITSFSNAQCMASMCKQFPNGVSHVGLVTNGLPIARSYVNKTGFENLNIELHRHLP